MLSIPEILQVTGGALLQGVSSKKAKGFSIDTRTLNKGNIFIAIKGQRFDGHDFLKQAVGRGAVALVIARKNVNVKKDIPVIYVKDTLKALGQIAHAHRKQFNIPLIAVTGSTGKTTTKEMVAAVLAARFRVLKSKATENNHIGVPLTLLKLNQRHEAAVIELGTNQRGDIRRLTQIAAPTIALLTNIGESHLQGLHSPRGVLEEKYRIVKYMSPKGTVIVNADNAYLQKILKRKTAHRLVSFGTKGRVNFKATDIKNKNSRLQFNVNRAVKVELKTWAFHNLYNALAAVSCGRLLDVPFKDIADRLKRFRFPSGRQSTERIGGCWLIDDSYNSNPVSFKSAVRTLCEFNGRGRKIMVSADMLELGRQSERLHRMVGRLAAEANLDLLITTGPLSRLTVETAKENNQHIQGYHCASIEGVHHRLRKYLKSGDMILIKGSRGMRMERTVNFLKEMLIS